jgi:hypothetical protein
MAPTTVLPCISQVGQRATHKIFFNLGLDEGKTSCRRRLPALLCFDLQRLIDVGPDKDADLSILAISNDMLRACSSVSLSYSTQFAQRRPPDVSLFTI